jgi:putative transcriptional regulator
MNNRIKEFRARLNLTQEELAQKVQVRRETIVFLEKNRYNPSLKLAYDLARVFCVPIEELFIFGDEQGQTFTD